MAKERISMRKIKEVLRLSYEGGLSMRQVAICCNLGRSTTQEYFRRFRAAGLSWPLAAELTEEQLENQLFPAVKAGQPAKEPLNYQYFLQELARPNVTMALLWEEYKQTHEDGYSYSQFCNLIRHYRKTLNYSMRQEHKAGEKTFVDFGEGLKLIDPKTGVLIPTRLYVAVWGASTYTFAAATLGEDLPSWLGVNVEALEYFGCCPKAIVPDNLKSAVTRACRYEPDLNPAFAEFARHYGLVIFPARPYRPKDKPKAENAVLLAKRWILAKLRDRLFFSLAEMNTAIFELLIALNDRPMKRLKKSRRELFEVLDRPNALPLPEKRYQFAEWKKVRVSIDYHVCFDNHYYSVPYTFIHQLLEVRATNQVVEILKKGERLCSHQRSYKFHHYTTKVEHMPKAHQQYLEWTPSRIESWAAKCGPASVELVSKIMHSRKFPEQAYRSCLGIIRLANHYSPQRLEQACRRALVYRVESYQGVKNILTRGLDKSTDQDKQDRVRAAPLNHENIRGSEYYLALENASDRVPAPGFELTNPVEEAKIELPLIAAH